MVSIPFLRRDPLSLKGERVTLRMPVQRDYQEWAALREASRGFLEKWEPTWAWDELDEDSWRDRLKRYKAKFEKGTAITFFIFDNQSGALVGGITLGNIRHGVSQSSQIGYWVGERFAGQGYMLDAIRLLIPFAFGQLRLHRVEAACIPGNNRSMRVLEKAGFQREGLLRSYLRINGIWQDHFLYALIKEDRGETSRG